MGGHDIYHIRSGLFQVFHIYSLFVPLYDTSLKPHMSEIMPGTPVCRVLHGNPSVSAQDGTEKHQQIVISRAHQDLFRFAVNTPCPVEIL